ncbi:hypothetical protein GCM10009101_02010 [Brevundimonas lenta]
MQPTGTARTAKRFGRFPLPRLKYQMAAMTTPTIRQMNITGIRRRNANICLAPTVYAWGPGGPSNRPTAHAAKLSQAEVSLPPCSDDRNASPPTRNRSVRFAFN